MFKFNFMGGGEGGDAGEAPGAPADQEKEGALRPSTEQHPTDGDTNMQFADFRVSETCSICKAANPIVEVSGASIASTSAGTIADSDLVPGQYEGGYKVWECSIDLSRYLANSPTVSSVFTADAKVIELGCGQGLVGITALALGAGEVHFQDYDASVIQDLTIPVVTENIRTLGANHQARFFAGDWATLPADILRPNHLANAYDVVLTTETIYNERSSIRLLSCIKSCLKSTGICYLSAKSFYFGVGGGIAGFQKLVDRDGTFRHRMLQVIDDGRSNRREILELVPV